MTSAILQKFREAKILHSLNLPLKQARLMGRTVRTCFVFFLILGQTAVPAANDTGDVSRMSVHQVKERLGSPDTVIIDVRKHRNWWRSSKKIPTAVREDPSRVDQWLKKFTRNLTLVFYCS